MFQKKAKLIAAAGRMKMMEKGRGRRVVFFVAQIICTLLLFRLLYTELFTFNSSTSHHIKWSQNLSNWKVGLSITVEKDDSHRFDDNHIVPLNNHDNQVRLDNHDHQPQLDNQLNDNFRLPLDNYQRSDNDHNNSSLPSHQSSEHNQQSLDYLLTRLLRDEDRSKLDTTGLICDRNSWSLVCVSNKQVKIDTRTMEVHLPPSTGENTTTTTTVVRPYAMQDKEGFMQYIRPITITTTGKQPTCDHYYQHPAVIFSTGGYTGNLFHEFNENLIPLFLTTRLFRSQIHFIVVDYKPSFIKKYAKVYSRLSAHEIINPALNSSVHCFPAAIVGLKYHKFQGIDSSQNPQGYTMPDFREFIRKTYRLRNRSVFEMKNPPALLLISRRSTRKFLNEAEMVRMMRRLGFRVIIASSNKEMSNVEKFSRVVNSCSVMVGAHGAGLANEEFLPDGAVVIQIRPLGFQWGTDSFYSEPAPGMGLKYLEYRIDPKESSLAELYGLGHPVVADTASVAAKGYEAARAMYLDKQDMRLNLSRFRETLVEALGFITRHSVEENVH